MPFPPESTVADEDPSSPFYGVSHIVKAAKPLNLADALGGRFCTKTRMWVPRHRLKYVDGKPYFDQVAVDAGRLIPDPPQGGPIEND